MHTKITIALLLVFGVFYIALVGIVNFDGDPSSFVQAKIQERDAPSLLSKDPESPLNSIERFDPATDPQIILPQESSSEPLRLPELAIPAPSDLNQSSSLFAETIDSLAPGLTKWLLPDEQVRKWVLTIDKLAEGQIPRKYRPVEFSIESFKAMPDETELVISDTNYNRMKPFLDGIMSISPKTAANYYQAWQPVLEEAYSELGKSGSFHQQFQKAIDNILAAKDAPTFAALTRPHALYQYKDQAFEEASDLEKLLWRLGPKNMHELQDYLREIKVYLFSR